jgi:hypothetical protein
VMKIYDMAAGPYPPRVRIALAEKKPAIARPVCDGEPSGKESTRSLSSSPGTTQPVGDLMRPPTR